MKQLILRSFLLSALSFALFTTQIFAQNKQQYTDLSDALRTGFSLYGSQGPESVNWTNGGDKYSFTSNGEIRMMDPQTQKDELVFTAKGLTFPGSTKTFDYDSFQWSRDSKHLVFKTNVRRIYRRS